MVAAIRETALHLATPGAHSSHTATQGFADQQNSSHCRITPMSAVHRTTQKGTEIMNPLRLITSPVSTLTRAITAPLNFIFVVGLCLFINWMVSPGNWWVKWVAFGMGINVIVAWARVAKLLFVVTVLAAIGYVIYKRYGAEAKARYDAWRKDGEPKQPDQAVQFLIESQAAPKPTQRSMA